MIASDFDVEKTLDACLRILLWPGGCVITTQDIHSDLVQYLKTYRFTDAKPEEAIEILNLIFLEEPLLHKEFYKSEIYFSGYPCLLIPKAYAIAQPEDFLNFSHQIDDSHSIYKELVETLDLQLCYAIPDKVDQLIQTALPSAIKKNTNTKVLQQFIKLNGAEKEDVFGLVTGNYLELFYFRRKQIVYYNRFQFQAPNDFVYFVIMTYNHFNIDRENTATTFFGDITEESSVFKQLYKYIRYIHLGNKLPTVHLSPAFESIDHHRYFSSYCINT